jgi:hypothetical protein
LDRPLRLARVVTGLYSDGWSADRVGLTQYSTPGDKPALLQARFERPSLDGARVGPARVTIEIGTLRIENGLQSMGRRIASRSVVVAEGDAKTLTVPAPRPPFRVEIRVTPTFSPAVLGLSADGRQLGVLASFSVLRR